MSNTQINIRVDEGVKKRAQAVYARQGLTIQTAVNIFLTQSANGGYVPITFPQKEKTYAELGQELSAHFETGNKP